MISALFVLESARFFHFICGVQQQRQRQCACACVCVRVATDVVGRRTPSTRFRRVELIPYDYGIKKMNK
jgi:hypothetical protein